jgi:hypothetical protein
MTAYSQTVRNNLWPFSNAGANISLWGTELWGGYWGYEPTKPGYDIRHVMAASGPVLSSAKGAFNIVHVMAASGPVLSSAKGAFYIVHYMTADGPVLSDLFAKSWQYTVVADGIVLTSDPASETLQDAKGYIYVYGNASNAENRVLTQYSSAAVSDVTWTQGTGGTTVWS